MQLPPPMQLFRKIQRRHPNNNSAHHIAQIQKNGRSVIAADYLKCLNYVEEKERNCYYQDDVVSKEPSFKVLTRRLHLS